MNLRVLLVESEPEDVLFLRDVLIEIEAARHFNQWIHIEILHASTWSGASTVLANEPVDLVLLNPDLDDCKGLETFRRAQAVADRVPIILLIGSADDVMALRMVRDGAQDFFIKHQIDCAPLAHAMLNAVERHRLLSATRAAATIDSLTGLPNRAGFFIYADRDRKIAERLGRRMMVLIAEPKNLQELAATFGSQRLDLALVETADHLRSVAGPTDLIARIGDTRYALAIFETDVESIEEAWARLHGAALEHRISIGAAVFDADHPASLEMLLEQAALDLAPTAVAAQR
jgi:diguanylate cyclase (GGDEF)-like protein